MGSVRVWLQRYKPFGKNINIPPYTYTIQTIVSLIDMQCMSGKVWVCAKCGHPLNRLMTRIDNYSSVSLRHTVPQSESPETYFF